MAISGIYASLVALKASRGPAEPRRYPLLIYATFLRLMKTMEEYARQVGASYSKRDSIGLAERLTSMLSRRDLSKSLATVVSPHRGKIEDIVTLNRDGDEYLLFVWGEETGGPLVFPYTGIVINLLEPVPSRIFAKSIESSGMSLESPLAKLFLKLSGMLFGLRAGLSEVKLDIPGVEHQLQFFSSDPTSFPKIVTDQVVAHILNYDKVFPGTLPLAWGVDDQTFMMLGGKGILGGAGIEKEQLDNFIGYARDLRRMIAN